MRTSRVGSGDSEKSRRGSLGPSSLLVVLEGYMYVREVLGRSLLPNIDDFKTPMPN